MSYFDSIGIVGSEGAKFTPETEAIARDRIRQAIRPYITVVSGGCHLGGIDIWAIDEAVKMGKEIKEFLPKQKSWYYYKQRNIKIAENSKIVICITVAKLPEGYKAKGFEHYCYHCKTNEHIKSGGCWTVKYAQSIGKPGYVSVI